MRHITTVVIHHSAMPGSTFEDIDDLHRARGWDGIGYHWFITNEGTLREGRPEDQAGAHCRGHNADSIGICLSGDLRDGCPPPMWMALVDLVRDICRCYEIPYSQVRGHREMPGADTECPGFDAAILRRQLELT